MKCYMTENHGFNHLIMNLVVHPVITDAGSIVCLSGTRKYLVSKVFGTFMRCYFYTLSSYK